MPPALDERRDAVVVESAYRRAEVDRPDQVFGEQGRQVVVPPVDAAQDRRVHVRAGGLPEQAADPGGERRPYRLQRGIVERER
ncbi:hypothetical protein RKD18_006453 [Streptomyces phaeoluteigriseus]